VTEYISNQSIADLRGNSSKIRDQHILSNQSITKPLSYAVDSAVKRKFAAAKVRYRDRYQGSPDVMKDTRNSDNASFEVAKCIYSPNPEKKRDFMNCSPTNRSNIFDRGQSSEGHRNSNLSKAKEKLQTIICSVGLNTAKKGFSASPNRHNNSIQSIANKIRLTPRKSPFLNFEGSQKGLTSRKILKHNRSSGVLRKSGKENISAINNANLSSNASASKHTPVLTMRKPKVRWEGDSWANINNELSFGDCLGQGSFARVYEAFDKKTQLPVAVKVIDKREVPDQHRRKMIEEEIDILFKMEHPSIVKALRMIEDNKRIFIVMERCGEYTLSRFARKFRGGRFKEAEAKLIFKQVVSAVAYIHRLGFCHRDLKMTNILMDRHLVVKVIDFGFATADSRELHMYCGTPSYMAPEIVNRDAYNGRPVDVWALGVVLFKLFSGEYPFGGIL